MLLMVNDTLKQLRWQTLLLIPGSRAASQLLYSPGIVILFINAI